MQIERAVVVYLLSYFASHPTLSSVMTGKVFYRRVPPNVKLPYMIVTNSGGGRKKLAQCGTGSSEARDILTLYINDDQQFRGEQIAEAVMRALENYRGNMPSTNPIAYDTHFYCGTTRDLDGFQDAFTYLITVYVRYKFPTAFPN